jgi:hypothetical protein
MQHRLAEHAAIQARLLELDAEEATGACHPAQAPLNPLPALLVDPATVDKACAAAAALQFEAKKISLLELVPGFKANPLDASEYMF